MEKKELISKLKKLKIKNTKYSLDGELVIDSIVFSKIYNTNHVFYYDEKGNKIDEKTFLSENDAYDYIYKLFKDAKEIEMLYKLKVI